jgi:hypothetical protein
LARIEDSLCTSDASSLGQNLSPAASSSRTSSGTRYDPYEPSARACCSRASLKWSGSTESQCSGRVPARAASSASY